MASIGRKGARRLPQVSSGGAGKGADLGTANVGLPDPDKPPSYITVWYEIKELLRRVWQLENGGGAGPGTVVSITATSPIVVAPSPITTIGVVSHATSGVSAATYGDATHSAQITVDAKGHITAASDVAISGGGGGGSSLFWALVLGQ